MQTIKEFCNTYRLYRKAGHPIRYCARIAYGCAVHKLPF